MYSMLIKHLLHPMFKKDDLPLRERIVGPTMKVRFLCFRSLHKLLDEVTIWVEVDTASMRRILGIKQGIPVVMFLWSASGPMMISQMLHGQ